jgi:hypothetical protein
MRRLAPTSVVSAVVAVAFVCAVLGFFVLPGELVDNARFKGAATDSVTEEKRLKARHDVRTVGMQLVGALALIVGGALTWRTVWLTREGQITERMATAMQRLTEVDPTQRVAAITALGRVARDSHNDHPAVMALLAQHLRSVCPVVDEDGNPKLLGKRNGIDPEVRAVAMVLRARRVRWDAKDPQLNFSQIDLRNAPLQGVNLRRADLTGSNFRGAFMSDADLSEARLIRATLQSTNLQRSNLTRASLTGANLRFTHAEGACLRGAQLDEVEWERTELQGADLRAAKDLPDSVRSSGSIAFDAQTRWPGEGSRWSRRR